MPFHADKARQSFNSKMWIVSCSVLFNYHVGMCDGSALYTCTEITRWLQSRNKLETMFYQVVTTLLQPCYNLGTNCSGNNLVTTLS